MSGFLSAGIVDGGEIPDETVDNYETVDADPPGVYESGQTLADYYTGSTGAFARTSTDAIEGGQSVETTTETANVFIISDPGEGLNKYPSHNDTMSFLIQDNGIAGQVYCGSGANDTGYSAVVNSGSDQIEIRRLDGQGNFIPPLGTTTVTLDGTTWYWGEVDIPSDGGSSHEFRLYGLNTSDLTRGSLLATVTASDSNFTTDLGVGVARHSSAGTGLINDRSRIE